MQQHPAELNADFQQTYHIQDVISQVENGEISIRYVADLCEQLPYGSRIHVAQNPDMAWSKQEQLLSHVVYLLECGLYIAARGKGKKPKPIFQPSRSGKELTTTRAIEMEAIADLVKLGMAGGLVEVGPDEID